MRPGTPSPCACCPLVPFVSTLLTGTDFPGDITAGPASRPGRPRWPQVSRSLRDLHMCPLRFRFHVSMLFAAHPKSMTQRHSLLRARSGGLNAHCVSTPRTSGPCDATPGIAAFFQPLFRALQCLHVVSYLDGQQLSPLACTRCEVPQTNSQDRLFVKAVERRGRRHVMQRGEGAHRHSNSRAASCLALSDCLRAGARGDHSGRRYVSSPLHHRLGAN